MKHRICVMTAGHLSTCPRMLKAADALAEAGYRVRVVSARHTGWAAASDAEVCRRWGITTWQLRAIRERVKDGAKEAFARGRGRPRKDQDVVKLEADLERTNKALRELAIENTLLRGKVD